MALLGGKAWAAVDNGAGASVSVGQAVLRGNLTGSTSDIYIFWGLTDGGQSTNYEHVVKLANVPAGAFSTNVTGTCGFTYHYICLASNAGGAAAWASASTNFALPQSANGFTYSLGVRGSVFNPMVFNQASVDLSGALYSNSFTRVFTGSKAGTILTTTEVPGRNVILSGPVNSWNEFGGTPGDTCAAVVSGRFFPPVSGTYTFRWSNDDRGWLFIDTGNDGVFDSGDAVGTWAWDGIGSKTLTAGQGYNFMFFSQDGGGGDSILLWYTPPGGSEMIVNPSAQAGQWCYASGSAPVVSITNALIGNPTTSSATLKGGLYGTNWTFDVYAYWGRADGGNVAGNWETNAFVGRFQNWNGPVSLAVNGLTANSLYHYTFLVTNELMSAWATPSQSFVPGEVTIVASDASASETGPDTGSFRVVRPDTATNDALTVYYTLSGTAVNGSDYAALTGNVVIPAGAASADFLVSPIHDLVWQEGSKTAVATLASGNYLIGSANSAVVTIQDDDASPSAWFQRMPLKFTGYNRAETLTNFPVLVTLDMGMSGFSYSQFLSGANGDLRFMDGTMTRELCYEIESWNTNGQSRVWVQIPAFTNNATIWMLWRRAGLTAPVYTTDGSTWSAGYVAVAHLSEASGAVRDSSPYRNNGTQIGFPVQAAPGMIGTGVQFDGLDDLISFGTVGRPYDNFTFSAWVRTSLGHEIDAESTSSTAGTSGQKYAFDVETGGASSSSAGLSVGTNGLSVYELASSYMPPLAVSSNAIGSGWNFVTVTYLNRQPRIYRNGSLVCTGLASPRSPIYAPYRIGGQVANSYGFFNGFMDEVRISSLSRSTNWIWAEYMNIASNSVLASYGTPLTTGYPEIANQPASGVADTGAMLNSYLSATGMASTAVVVYWGTTDGGTDAGAWANTNWFSGSAVSGVFSTNITGLTSGTFIYYRFAATNAYGTVWASATETLLTGPVTLQAIDASAAEEPMDTGLITVSRGSAYAGPLTVYYTLSGTAVNGVDVSYLTGSVVIPAGSASADIVVSPLFNRNYLVRPTDTVTLTLAAGGYQTGSPNADTVTITNWQPSSTVGFDVPRNFISASADPLTGSATLVKTGAGQMMVGGSSGNTFKGDIVVDTEGYILRVGAIPGAASGIGVTLPGMTAANTITVKRGGQFYIDDNGTYSSVGSAPNRFGTEGNRPSVALAGGTLTLNGASYATTVPQNFNSLSLGSGYNTVTANRNAGTPELVFSNVTQAKGSHVNFSGTSLGAATNNAPHVRFTSPPALVGGNGAAGSTTMSIVPGARFSSDWVTHDGATGVRALTNEYNTVANDDINAAGATENVRMTNAIVTYFPPLLADKTVNSLVINVVSNTWWNPTNKLTLTSGQLMSGVQNNQMVINYPSTLTVGSGSDASLDVSVFQNITYLRPLICDNGSGKVTLTKNGGGQLTLDGAVDNTYSGGTYVNEGVLTTGGTANRRYLGPGPVRVDAAQLTLGQAGATANASGYDYVGVNGAEIGVAAVPYTADDTFNIESGSVIYGASGAGIGLNSLDRGIGVAGSTPNITLASDAIIAHSYGLTGPLNATNTIRNLGTNADLYYGLTLNQDIASGAITIGKGTAFKGLSTDRYDRRWSAGTINVTPGTSEIWFQGMIKPGGSPNNLYLGYWLFDGGPIVAPDGPLTANILGSVILSDSSATYGDTSAGKPVTFAVKAGATLAVERPNGMGCGNGIAFARVEDGGTLTPWTPAGVNGPVTVKAGGRFNANNSGGLTGSGAVTFESGSILEISTPLGFSGSQADAIAASLPPGQLVRLNADNYGSPVDTLESHLGSKSPIYEVYGGDRRPANPLVAGTTVMTLNRDAATGLGGMLVNDYASHTYAAAADGLLVIGPNGGTIAATSNTILYVSQPMSLGANALTIGATDVLDRVLLPKLGTVYLNVSFGLNSALPGSSITVIPGATLQNAYNAIPDDPDVTVNGTFLLGSTETIGSLAGSGLVNLQGNSLTVGRNNRASTFSGLLTNSVVSALFTKAGTNRLDITSSGHPYTGMFTVNNGILALSGNGAMATPAGTVAYTLSGNGTLLLDNSAVNNRDRLAGVSSGVTFQGGTFRFIGKNGEASGESLGAAVFSSGDSTIDIVNGTDAGSSAEVVFAGAVPLGGTVNFSASNGTLGTAGDNPRVFFNGLSAGLLGFATVGTNLAYYSLATGVRAYTLAEGIEFNGTVDQTGLDTTYTTANNHLALNASRSVNSLWIDSPGAGTSVNLGSSGAINLTLASGRLSLTGNNDFEITRSGTSSGTLTRNASGTLFLGVGSGRSLTVSVPIANGAGLVNKDGAGTLVLNATNTFTGALSINEGTVRYASSGYGDLSGNAVNIWNSGMMDFAGDTDTLGALTIYSGGITNSVAGGSLTVSSLTMGSGPAGSSTYVQTGTGSLKLGGNVTFSVLNDPDMASIRGKLDLNGGTRTFTVNNSFAPGAAIDMDLSAVVSGAAGFGILRSGAGVLRLSGANTFDGSLIIYDGAGTTVAANPQALGVPTLGRTLFVGVNDTLALDGSNGNIAVPALYTNLFLAGTGDYQIGPVRGALTSVAGTNTVMSPVTLTSNAVYIASLKAGGKLILSNTISGVQDLTVNGDGDTELGGPITTGAKALIKNGDGTLTLSGIGTNTFTGTTTVNDGTLLLAKANGSLPVNAIANGAVTVSDGAVLRYAASSANPDMIGTGAMTINGTGRLDFNGASDTIGALSIAPSGATVDTTNLLNTAGGGNLTVASLTVQPAQGLLTRMDIGTGTLTLGGNVTFNANTTGRALISGNNLSLGGATRTLTVNTGIASNYDLAIDAVISGGAAGAGITKSGGGMLRLGGANTFDGNLSVGNSLGTVVLGNSQALGTPSAARTVSIGTGDTLVMDGVGIYDPNNRITLSLNGTGDLRLGAVSGALVSLSGSNTVPCAITLAGAAQIASKQAGGKLTLTGAFSGANALTVAGAGETALAGANGTILAASAITVISNGMLRLDNTALNNNANRVGNSIPVTLAGGAFGLSGDGGATNFTETVGALTISFGSNTVFASQAASGYTSALVFASITCAGGTVNFVGDGLGVNAQNRIFIAGQADGMIGPWATINGTNLAFYSSTRGVYAGSGAEVGIAALGNDPNAVIPNDETVSAVINKQGSSGPITLAAQWTNRVLEVRQETVYASVVAMTNDTGTKALQTSRLMIKAGNESLTIGQAENSGSLMALWSGGTLSLENRNASETLTVNAAIVDNSAASGLSKFGAGTVLLTGSNSYSGATLINDGNLEFSGSLAQKLSGVISGAGTLAKSGTNQLQLLGANSSFTGPIYVNAGTIRPDQNSAFGASGGGVFIADGATLDLGCDSAVGGTRNDGSLALGMEEFTVCGTGVGGVGAIVNNGNVGQLNSINRIYLSGDTLFGGKSRWDIRNNNPLLFFNDHTLTKTGVNELAIIAPVYPGSGNMVINQGLIRFESGALINGNASNTVTVNRGAKLELYNLTPFVPGWSLIVNDGGSFQGGTYNTTTTNMSVWGGPVTLNGTAFMYGYSYSGMVNWTILGDISGPGTLVRTGTSSSTLWLTGTNNTYSGGTIVSNGTLYAKCPGSLPGYDSGKFTLASTGVLSINSSDGTTGWAADQLKSLHDASTFTTNTVVLNIDTSLANLDYAGNFVKPMSLIKQGTNSLTLRGLNTFTGYLTVNGGALTMNGAGSHAVGAITIGNAAMLLTNTATMYVNIGSNCNVIVGNGSTDFGQLTMAGNATLAGYRYPKYSSQPTLIIGNSGRGLLTLQDNASITQRLYVGNGVGSAGAVYQNGGIMHNWGGTASDGRIGDSGYGYYELNSGTFTNMGYFQLGHVATGVGVLKQTGGSFQMGAVYDGTLAIARAGTGVVYVAGGTFATSTSMNIGEASDYGISNGYGVFTLASPAASAYIGGNVIMADRTNMFATVNLNGGILTANQFTKGTRTGSQAIINFDGGTFCARTSGNLFNTGVNAPDAVNIYDGGATFDTTNLACTIPVPLVSPVGNGVSAIGIAPRGGYIGPPMVTLSGGGGTGATAIAQFDSASGFVNGITVTSPGYGYTGVPTVSLSGGGTNVYNTAIATLSANVGGGLTKVGTGTLTLSAANTYTGVTTIAGGTLKLGTAAALMTNSPIMLAGGTLDLGGFTVSNLVSGSGTVSNGTFSTTLSPNGPGVLGTNTLALGSATTVKGTYVADVTASGRCDRLNIQGNIDLSNLDLRIVDANLLDPAKVYTIMSCTGTVSGRLTIKNVGLDSRWHVVNRPDGSVQLRFTNGTFMFMR
jgi:autotransporter-associated beta strand protein